jgi:tetratricopeptide (TPR) repeat protein
MTCARAHMLAGDDERSRERFVATALELADTLRDTGEAALARGILEEARDHALGGSVLEAELLRASASLDVSEGDTERGLARLREAIAIALTLGSTDLLVELYLELSAVYLRAEEPERALQELEEVINIVTLGEGLRATGGPAAMWRVMLRMARLYDAAKRPDDARATAEAGLAHAERADARPGIAHIHGLLAELCASAGDTAGAERNRRAAMAELRRLGDRRATAELLLAGSGATQEPRGGDAEDLREARALAAEVGWTEGVERANALLGA